jgi:GWxTD domain-containing protein
MRRDLTSALLVVVMLLSLAAVAVAQDHPARASSEPAAAAVDWKQWDEGPEGFLLTKDEAKEWKTITTEAQAKQFIELFWARRNPNPEQPFNTFRAQIDAFVRYADANFSYEGKRGALTDRGRVMILMGQPHYVENRAPTETVESMDDTAAGTDEVRANAQLWGYDPQRLDPTFKIKGSRLVFVFYEERPTTNIFTMDRSHQDATMALRALTKAPETHLLHPELTEVPKPVSVPGAVAASAASLALLGQDAPFTEQATIIAEPGVADAGHRPWWVHIELPPDAPALESLVGRVLSPSGELLSTFERPVETISFGGHTAYHVTFPLVAGDYRIELAGVAAGRPVVAYGESVTVPEAAVEGTWLSRVFVGLYGEKKEDALLGSAYCFGKLHVLPMSRPEVTRQNELSYFGFVVRPSAVENNQAALKSHIELRRGATRLGRPLDMPLTAVQVTTDLYVYANSINLAALPETGEYTIIFQVSDPSGAPVATLEVPLNVTE